MNKVIWTKLDQNEVSQIMEESQKKEFSAVSSLYPVYCKSIEIKHRNLFHIKTKSGLFLYVEISHD